MTEKVIVDVKERLIADFSSFLKRRGHIGDPDYSSKRREQIRIEDPAVIEKKLEMVRNARTETNVQNSFNTRGEDYGLSRDSIGQQKLLRWLLDRGVQDVRTLSIGCGPAFHEIYLAQKGVITKEVVGVDFAENLLNFGKRIAQGEKVGNINFINKKASEISYKDEFEQTFIIDSLHWMDDWQGCLKKSSEALRNSGSLFMIYVEDSRTPISLKKMIPTLFDCNLMPLRVDMLTKIDKSGTRVCIFARKKGENLETSFKIPVYKS
jgi:ubiquinone/menaquinone biosynthesis C-methylase UbiE